MSDSAERSRADRTPLPQKHNHARRALVKTLAAAAGAAATATVVPKTWVKPVVDSVVVPLHAQASPAGVLAGFVEFDGGDGGVFSDGTHTSAALQFDTSVDVDGFAAEIDPPVGGVTVELDLARNGTNDAGLDTDIDAGGFAALTNDLGQAAFGVVAVYSAGADGQSSDATNGFTATFSAPGYADSVVVITFPAAP